MQVHWFRLNFFGLATAQKMQKFFVGKESAVADKTLLRDTYLAYFFEKGIQILRKSCETIAVFFK